jgi:hypothetical protein
MPAFEGGTTGEGQSHSVCQRPTDNIPMLVHGIHPVRWQVLTPAGVLCERYSSSVRCATSVSSLCTMLMREADIRNRACRTSSSITQTPAGNMFLQTKAR